MEFDGVDELLRDKRITDKEWKAFAVVLEIKNIEKIDDDKKPLIVNKEFRRYFGNTLINIGRNIAGNNYSPDYEDPILKDACCYLGISDDISPNASVLEIEESIFKCIGKDRVFNKESYDIYVKDILEAADAKDSLIKKLIGGATGAAVRLLGKTAGILGVSMTTVNAFFFDTNWRITLATIMLAHTIRKNLLLKDLFDNNKIDDI